jgi:uncharacterized protein YwgA
MFDNYLLVAGVIEAHPDRQILGRSRLQKTVYLLQRKGLPTDYIFSLQSRGPYSEELRSDKMTISAFGLGVERSWSSDSTGEYFIVTAFPVARNTNVDPFRGLVQNLAATDPTVLELAATYEAFREMGSDHDDATRSLTAMEDAPWDARRFELAMGLLRELHLSAPELARAAASE